MLLLRSLLVVCAAVPPFRPSGASERIAAIATIGRHLPRRKAGWALLLAFDHSDVRLVGAIQPQELRAERGGRTVHLSGPQGALPGRIQLDARKMQRI